MKSKEFILNGERLVKLGATLYVIGTSIYDIREDVTALKKEHGLLLIGLVSLVKTILEIRKKIKELQTEAIELRQRNGENFIEGL